MRSKRGSVIGVFSAKGGVGKTTVVTNLGAALAQEFKDRVLVFEANMAASNLGLHLGILDPPAVVQEVVFGGAKTEDAIVSFDYGLHLLAGSPAFDGESGMVDLCGIIEPLRSKYDAIILDSAPSFGPEVTSALKACDIVIIVCQPRVPAIAGTLQTLRAADKLKIPVFSVVLDGVRNKRYEISTPEIKRTLGWQTIFEVPEDDSVLESIARGLPVVIYKPNSPAAVGFRKLASAILQYIKANHRVDACRKNVVEQVEGGEH